MTRSELNNAIVAAWREAAPITDEQALTLAQSVYGTSHQKEWGEFQNWFRKNGATAVARVNGG